MGAEPTRTPGRAAASGWIGSALEFYDFFVYATAASLVFPKLFFPAADPQVGIVASLATFGVAYAARPLGAVLMGHLGDRIGRKPTLLLSVLGMGVTTFLVGCLPTYGTIGIWAPILLVFLRLLQGVAVAGDQAGANALILEHAPPGRRGYFCSFTLQGTQFGQIIAAAAFIPLTATLSGDAMLGWGWRVPFWTSAVVALVALYIRRNVDETPAFRAQTAAGRRSAPIVELFRDHKANMLRVLAMAMTNAVAVTTQVFGTAYATQGGYGLGLSATMFLWIPVLANIVAVLTIPLVGRLSDRIGRRPPLVVGALSAGLLMYAYLYFIQQHNAVLALITAIVMWGVLYQGYNAVYGAFWQEQFPTRVRVSAVAVSSNVGFALTGLIPALETALAPPGSTVNIPLVVGSVVLVSVVLAAIGAATARETHRVPLGQLGIRHGSSLDAGPEPARVAGA